MCQIHGARSRGELVLVRAAVDRVGVGVAVRQHRKGAVPDSILVTRLRCHPFSTLLTVNHVDSDLYCIPEIGSSTVRNSLAEEAPKTKLADDQ